MSRVSMKKLRALFILSLFAVFAVTANAFDLAVKASVDNSQIFIGDRFNYEIQVTAPRTPSWTCRVLSVTLAALKSRK